MLEGSFIKWAGGKKWLASRGVLPPPTSFNHYFEPFLGGGAIFFSLSPRTAYLSDLNSELIETYRILKENPEGLKKKLSKHQQKHSRDYYYTIRANPSGSPLARAARFIYLNKACWNGLYRVNAAGQFNVPIGTNTNIISDQLNLHNFSKALKNASLKCCDFEETIKQAKAGDLIFADPPYTVKHNKNGFIGYNEKIFSWADQERLANALGKAAQNGVKLIITNANHESIHQLYYFAEPHIFSRTSLIAGSAQRRGLITEAIFTANIGLSQGQNTTPRN